MNSSLLVAYKRSLVLLTGLLLLTFCAKNSLSDRDAKREQLKSSAETKRKELQIVAGEYYGRLVQSSGGGQTAALTLEIKDIPTSVDGQVDPVMVPTLKGYLKLIVGATTEYEGFAIESADFDAKNKKLDAVATHVHFKELVMTSQLNGTKLTGSWTVPSSATSGTLTFDRAQNAETAGALKGTYQGTIANTHPQSNLPERIMLSIVTAQDPSSPNSLKLSGSLRLYLGPFGSNEFVEHAFSEIQYNVFTRRLIAKTSDDPKFTLNGELKADRIAGMVSADALGEVGKFEVIKQ